VLVECNILESFLSLASLGG